MTGLLDPLLGAPGWLVLTIIGLVVFAEDALFVGFVVPGETAAVLGGVAARLGHVAVPAVLAVVVLAAVAGDSVGYEVGRRFGRRLLALRIFDRRRHRLEQAQRFLARRGGAAVLLGRWTAFLRAVMPALAGMSRMPYRRFLAYNASGGVLWSAAVVSVGYLAGASYARIEQLVGRAGAVAVLVVVVAAAVVWAVRRRRHEVDPDDAPTG